MAWADSLLDASFRGVKFDVLKTEDVAERALAEHSYPYLDGADIEDLGEGARTISIEAIFWGADYETRLQAFLKAIDQPGSGELVHPVFGSIKNAQLRRHRILHQADDVDQAAVSLEFVESTPGNPFFDRSLPSQKADVVGQHGDLARGAAATALANAIDGLRNALPLASLTTLRQSMSGPLLSTLSQVQGVLSSGMDVINYPRAWANDISAVVDGVLNIQDFGTNVSASWRQAGNVFQLFDVFTGQGSGASGGIAPPAPIVSAIAPTEAQAVAAVSSYIAVSQAVGYADAAGFVLAAEAQTPTLRPDEIEVVANTARGRLEDAIASTRAIYQLETSRTIVEPLKDQALAVQEAARAIIEARPPLVDRTVEAPGNLRLLAHRWYGDHTRAPELYRLNNLRLPNFIQPGDVLHAYAV